MSKPIGKRALQKLTTQCMNDVMGRIKSADLRKDDEYEVIDLVRARLHFILLTQKGR